MDDKNEIIRIDGKFNNAPLVIHCHKIFITLANEKWIIRVNIIWLLDATTLAKNCQWNSRNMTQSVNKLYTSHHFINNSRFTTEWLSVFTIKMFHRMINASILKRGCEITHARFDKSYRSKRKWKSHLFSNESNNNLSMVFFNLY